MEPTSATGGSESTAAPAAEESAAPKLTGDASVDGLAALAEGRHDDAIELLATALEEQ